MSRLPKQLIWSVLLWLIVSLNAWAEDELTITVTPESLSTNSSVEIVVTDLERLSHYGSQRSISSRYSLDGNIVKLYISIAPRFAVSVPTQLITHVNTKLGILPAGPYKIELYLIVIDEIINTPRLIQIDSFSVLSNTNSIPSLSGIGVTLLSLTMAIFGGIYRLRKKHSKYTLT